MLGGNKGTLSTVTISVNSYVLISANLEDFKNLAQKFVPKNLAVKLEELVSVSSLHKSVNRNGGGQRKTKVEDVREWQAANEAKNYVDNERNEVQTPRVKTTEKTTTAETLTEPDNMHDMDYDRLVDTTFPEVPGKRYKTVQRMSTNKNWFEEAPSFHKSIQPKTEERPVTPSHSIYYKESRNKERENTPVVEGERSKQMLQYFPIANKPIEPVTQTKNETGRVRINARDISKIKQRKIRKIVTKVKDEDAIFDTIIMGKKKDSYEDYVTPKKDDDYLSDGIETTTKRRPIPSVPEGLRDSITTTIKSWQREDERDNVIAPITRKKPSWSILRDENDNIAVTTKEPLNLSVERDLRNKIGPTIKERPIWSTQRDLNEGFSSDTRRPPIYPVMSQRKRTEKSMMTTGETFPDYVEREWFTAQETSATENEKVATEWATTTEKEKTTDDNFLRKRKKDKTESFEEDKFYEEIKKEQVKARTERLLYNSKESEENRTSQSGFSYTMKGTGVPTREYYKMITPDYYKKLPRIVEKYDFNEPIPEADREREKIDDRLAQEPAMVNHKIRQQQDKAVPLEKRQENRGQFLKYPQTVGPLERRRPENTGFEKTHPETSSFVKQNPETSRFEKQNPETSRFVKQNPETSRFAKQNPETSRFVKQNPETSRFVKQNPETSRFVKQNPETGVSFEKRLLDNDGLEKQRQGNVGLEKKHPGNDGLEKQHSENYRYEKQHSEDASSEKRRPESPKPGPLESILENIGFRFMG